MAQTNYTPISLYYSATAAAVPTAANLVPGELAINTADGKLYYEDSSGVVQVLATKSTGSIGGSNTQVQFNNSGSLGGSSGLTWDGSFLTTSSIKNSALTSGRVTYAGASGLLSDSANFVYDSSERLIVGASSAAIGNRMEVVSNTGSQAIGIRGRVSDGAGVISWHPNASATEYARIQSDSNSALMFGTGSSGTERMRITSAGNVGIGTSSPSGKLQIDSANVDPSATANGITLINSTSSQATSNGGSISLGGVYTGSSITQFGYILGAKANSTDGNYAGYLSFGTRPNGDVSQERMRLDSSGNLGIGATSPVAKLHVKGSGTSGQVTASWILENSSSGTGGMDITGSAGASRWRFLYGGGPSTGTNALTEAMCIGTEGTNAGRVGIGTSSPSQPLTVNGVIASIGPATALSASSFFMDYNTTSNSGRLAAVGNTTGTAAPIYFSQYSSNASVGRDAMVIDSSGNLLVGTTSGVTNGGFSFEPNYNGGGVSAAFFGHSSSGGNGNQYCVFAYNGTFIGSITQSGTTAVLYNVTSDQRLKTNVVDAPSGNIDDIKIRSFDWIADGSHQEYGMVAQELIEVAPYAVYQPENPEEMMAVDYSKLVPMMIKEIQDLKAEVNQLKAKIGV